MIAFEPDDAPSEGEFDVGPIAFASVAPGLTIISGALGERREVNGVIVGREAEQDLGPVSNIIPANEGAGLHNVIGLGEPMIEPTIDVENREERLTFVAVQALMRPSMRPTGSGSSGGGRRRTKPKPPPLEAWAPDVSTGEVQVPRFAVTGLTAGERDFYARRPSEAQRVLRDAVGSIIRNEIEEPPRTFGARPPFAFDVYGLDEPEARILKIYPGSARAALVKHARDADGARVKAVDAS